MTHSSNQRRTAFSLTELAIVLAVVGVLIGAIWTAAVNVKNNNRASQAAQDMMQIASNIRSTYSGVNIFPAAWSGANEIATMIAAGVIPTDLINSSGGAQNAWMPSSGSVRVYISPTCPPAGVNNMRVFRVSFYGTPADACYRIASQLANIGTHDGPIQLITNSQDAGCGKNVAINTNGTTTGLSWAAITAACALNTAPSSDSTEFDFTIH